MGQNKKSIANRATEGVRTTSVGGSTTGSSDLLLILTNIDVSVPSSMVVGNQHTASAACYMAAGTVPGLTDDYPMAVTLVWASSNPNVATINASTGVITAVASGSVTITAVAQGTTSPVGTGNLTVVTPTPAILSIAVTPSNVSLNVNATQQFTATATYTDQTQGTPTPLAWDFSSGTTYASINSVTGVVTGVASFNTVVVRATSGNTSGTVQMAVYSSATTSQGYVPLLSENWLSYADTNALAAAYDNTGPWSRVLAGYNNGYQGVWETNMGNPVNSWRTRAYSLVSDAKFVNCVKVGHWGRDFYTYSYTTSTSAPTNRIAWQLGSTYSNIWVRRFVRFSTSSDNDPGGTDPGWSVTNDGTASYKLFVEVYDRPFQNNGNPHMRTYFEQTNKLRLSQNNASISSEQLVSPSWRSFGVANSWTFNFPTSAVSDFDGWFEYVTCFIQASTGSRYLGAFCRKAYTRGGASFTTSTGTVQQSLTSGDWRGTVYRHTNGVMPNGITAIWYGENWNGSLPTTRYMFVGPMEVVNGAQYPDPYGLLAQFNISAV